MIKWRPTANNTLARGLVAAYLMTDRAGLKLKDYSCFNNNGVLTNMANLAATDWIASPIGPCLNFAGADDLVLITTNASLNDMGQLSIVLLHNYKSGGAATGIGRRTLVGKTTSSTTSPTAGWDFRATDSSGVLAFTVDYATTDLACDATMLTADVFNVYVLTWTGGLDPNSSVGLFRNGQKFSTNNTIAAGSRVTDVGTPIRLGNNGFNTSNAFGGLGPVLIWNRALSVREVRLISSDLFLPFRVQDRRYFIQTPAAVTPPATTNTNQLMLVGVGT